MLRAGAWRGVNSRQPSCSTVLWRVAMADIRNVAAGQLLHHFLQGSLERRRVCLYCRWHSSASTVKLTCSTWRRQPSRLPRHGRTADHHQQVHRAGRHRRLGSRYRQRAQPEADPILRRVLPRVPATKARPSAISCIHTAPCSGCTGPRGGRTRLPELHLPLRTPSSSLTCAPPRWSSMPAMHSWQPRSPSCNEIANICEALGADVKEVAARHGLRQAHRTSLSRRRSGLGRHLFPERRQGAGAHGARKGPSPAIARTP